MPVLVSTVVSLELSRGSVSRGRTAFKHALIGGAVGTALGAMVGAVAGTADEREDSRLSGGAIGNGILVVGCSGLILGALEGAVVPRETWEEIELVRR